MRPDKETVRLLLDWSGEDVNLSEFELTEDVAGDPLGVEETTTTATLSTPSLEQLGWTQEEFGNPEITE